MNENLNFPITPIIQVKAGMKKINIKAIVLDFKYLQSKQDMMKNILEVLIADETASGIITVFDSQIMRYIDRGDILLMVGVYAKVFKNQLRLYASSNIQRIGDFCLAFNDKINISEDIKEVEQQPKLLNDTTGSFKQPEVSQSNERKSPANKLEVVGNAMKIKEEKRSPQHFDPKKKYSPYQQQQTRPPSLLSMKIAKPYNMSTKIEISASMKQLLELQRKPSSVNKPVLPQNRNEESPAIKKRKYSPIKAPSSSSDSTSNIKLRIAHVSSSSTNLFRGSEALEFKKKSLKHIFHQDP